MQKNFENANVFENFNRLLTTISCSKSNLFEIISEIQNLNIKNLRVSLLLQNCKHLLINFIHTKR